MALFNMCQSHTRHTKANSETTIVGAMEELGGEGNEVHFTMNAPLSIAERYHQTANRRPSLKPPDYIGQLRYAKEEIIPYLGRTTLQGKAGDPVGRR